MLGLLWYIVRRRNLRCVCVYTIKQSTHMLWKINDVLR